MSSRRSAMTLFSAPHDAWSHRTRIAIAEKGIPVDIIDVEPGRLPEDLLDLNPYHSVPTLVDRDLVLYDSRVIMEYVDERFPHPPLMPVDPVSRAQARLMLHRLERDWYAAADAIDALLGRARARRAAQGAARDDPADGRPLQGQAVFPQQRVLDGRCDHRADPVAAAALEHRPARAAAQPIMRYAQLVFSRPGFRASLSAAELEMRVA